jgi:hypothetical protein
MSKFFINRPNVAIVIALLTVIGGLVAMSKLPIASLCRRRLVPYCQKASWTPPRGPFFLEPGDCP